MSALAPLAGGSIVLLHVARPCILRSPRTLDRSLEYFCFIGTSFCPGDTVPVTKRRRSSRSGRGPHGTRLAPRAARRDTAPGGARFNYRILSEFTWPLGPRYPGSAHRMSIRFRETVVL
jgi:hypothetical protein